MVFKDGDVVFDIICKEKFIWNSKRDRSTHKAYPERFKLFEEGDSVDLDSTNWTLETKPPEPC